MWRRYAPLHVLSDQNTAAIELKLAVWFWKLHTDMHAVNNNWAAVSSIIKLIIFCNKTLIYRPNMQNTMTLCLYNIQLSNLYLSRMHYSILCVSELLLLIAENDSKSTARNDNIPGNSKLWQGFWKPRNLVEEEPETRSCVGCAINCIDEESTITKVYKMWNRKNCRHLRLQSWHQTL